MIITAPAREQTRARYPDEEGFVEREGVRIFWERYGKGEPTILFPPTWELVHSRCWKMQIPYFARQGRVVTFDPPGNGRSDRPRDAAAYERSELAEYAVAVLDAAEVERAVVVSMVRHGRVAHPCRRAPRSGQRPRLHRAGASGRRARRSPSFRSRRSSTRTRAGQRRIAITGCATGAVTSSSSFRRCSRSRTRRSRSRTASAGGSRRMPRPCSSAFAAGTPRSSTRRRRSSSVRESGARLS